MRETQSLFPHRDAGDVTVASLHGPPKGDGSEGSPSFKVLSYFVVPILMFVLRRISCTLL